MCLARRTPLPPLPSWPFTPTHFPRKRVFSPSLSLKSCTLGWLRASRGRKGRGREGNSRKMQQQQQGRDRERERERERERRNCTFLSLRRLSEFLSHERGRREERTFISLLARAKEGGRRGEEESAILFPPVDPFPRLLWSCHFFPPPLEAHLLPT